jgi:hypothetical protein
MTRYAESTEVPAERSRMEIERTLTRYGADQFMYGTKPDMAVIAFRAAGRNVRFSVPFPPLSEFERTKKGVRHEMKHREQARDQAVKQRWRALALCITQFEEEFYAHIVLPGGRTVYEETQQKVALAYESGKTPPLLPHF